MRTTINLPEDVYEIARSVARAKNVSFGDAIAELVRNGLNRKTRMRGDSDFPCFTVPEDTPPITLERTLEAEDEL
jgi:hypothetical protein